MSNKNLCFDGEVIDVFDDVDINYRIDKVAKKMGRPPPRKNTREFVINKLRSQASKTSE